MALATTAGWGAAVVSVSTTAGAVLGGSAIRRAALIKNPASNTATIYIGGSDLTNANAATDGFPLAPGESISLGAAGAGDALSQRLFAVVTAGTASLALLGGGS